MIVVDRPAPDFEGTAYFNGKVTKVTLSDYKGKWVLVCFYTGDFARALWLRDETQDKVMSDRDSKPFLHGAFVNLYSCN